MTQSHALAVAHVARLADGGPGDPAWRVTLHFHPDRLIGGVPIRRRIVGGSPRFGSAHLRLTAAVMERATFCYPDSFWQPEHFGVAAGRLGCPLEWHGGFRVTADDLRRNADYRAPEFAELGVSIARNGQLDPGLIGDAARTGRS